MTVKKRDYLGKANLLFGMDLCIVFLVENNIGVFYFCQCFLRRVVMFYNPQEAVVYQEGCVLRQAK